MAMRILKQVGVWAVLFNLLACLLFIVPAIVRHRVTPTGVWGVICLVGLGLFLSRRPKEVEHLAYWEEHKWLLFQFVNLEFGIAYLLQIFAER